MQIIRNTLGTGPNRVVLLSVVRNAELHLPFFVAYYHRLGITDFIFMDNGSSDNTQAVIQKLRVPLALYRCPQSYRAANYGMDWIFAALETHCRGQWCVIVDIDELFVYRNCEIRRLPYFIADLERTGRNAVSAFLVDMYAKERPEYHVGESFLKCCHYFDRLNDLHYTQRGRWLFGGVRHRIAGVQCCLTKYPLIKWTMRSVKLNAGCHTWCDRSNRVVYGPPEVRTSPRFAALLHFKFLLPNLEAFIQSQIEADQHWNDCAEYKAYSSAKIWETSFFDERCSVPFRQSSDLVAFFEFNGFPQHRKGLGSG